MTFWIFTLVFREFFLVWSQREQKYQKKMEYIDHQNLQSQFSLRSLSQRFKAHESLKISEWNFNKLNFFVEIKKQSTSIAKCIQIAVR